MSDMSMEQPLSSIRPEADVIAQVATRYEHENRRRTQWGVAALMGAAAAAGAIAFGGSHLDGKIAQEMPFSSQAQTIVENIDQSLVYAGELGVPLALGVIGGVKLMARRRPGLRAIDRLSSNDMNNGDQASTGLLVSIRKKAPAISVVGVGLGALTAGSVGTEITEGPSRPIAAFGTAAPGNEMIVQYEGASPMGQSGINAKLMAAIRQEAARRKVPAHELDLDLGVLQHKGKKRDTLALGIETKPSSPLYWAGNCRTVTAMVDKAADIPVGAELSVNGVPVHVVAQTEGTSAINRIGVVMDIKAEKTCLKQDAETPDHAITLEADKATAQEILTTAERQAPAPAVAISKEQYKQNSENFWRANVKPITNILALASITMAGVSMAGAMGSRLIRNRSGWATKMANGVTAGQLRATELLRSTKEGVATSIVGSALTIPGTLVVNSLESGLKTAFDFRTAMIGASIGIFGAVIGGGGKLLKLNKMINEQRDTRV